MTPEASDISRPRGSGRLHTCWWCAVADPRIEFVGVRLRSIATGALRRVRLCRRCAVPDSTWHLAWQVVEVDRQAGQNALRRVHGGRGGSDAVS
jgi:hypothetical protein